MATARDLVNSLLSQGLTKSGIARRLGINSSTISQITAGKKPAKNLIEPLTAIVEQRASIPERQIRQTKTGERARVRQSKKSAATVRKTKADSSGRLKIAEETRSASVAVRRLEKIAMAGGRVALVLTFDDGGTKRIFDRGGEYAQRLVADWRSSGQRFFDWLSELAESQLSRQGYGIIAESVVVGVAFVANYGEAAVLK